MRRSVRWPKAPNALGNALRRMASNLRAAGIEIQFSRVERLRLARQFAQTYFHIWIQPLNKGVLSVMT